ncbi:Outer membrane protein beta-barrel domain protein [Candidatus Hepatincola sp. Pdp]
MFLYQYIIFIFLLSTLPLTANSNSYTANSSQNNVTISNIQKNKPNHQININNKTITKTQIVTKNGKKITIIKITKAKKPHHKINKAKRKIKRAYKKHHKPTPSNQGQHSKPNHNHGKKIHHRKKKNKKTTIIIIKPSKDNPAKPVNPNPPNNDVQPIKVIPPKVFIIPPKVEPSNNIKINYQLNNQNIKTKYKGFIYEVNGALGKNSYSNNDSIGTTIAYKFSKNYYSGISFYNYNYQEDYSKSAGKVSVKVEPASNEVLSTNSYVLAWYNSYKISKNTILYNQLGIPFGVSNNSYSTKVKVAGYNHYGEWVEGGVNGEESFKGIFTMDLGIKYYLVSGLYVGSQYRLFIADINTNEYITPSNGSSYTRNLKAGRYNISSILVSLGYTFNAK